MASSRLLPPRGMPTDPESRALFQQYLKEIERENPRERLVIQSHLYQIDRPVDCVHLRHELADWWSQPGELQRRFAMQGRRPIDPTSDDPMEPLFTQRWMAEGIGNADLYWVSSEMCDLVETMAPSIPDALPQPPVENGLVFFSKSLRGTDAASGGEIYTTAFMWAPVETTQGWCISIETYSWREVVFVYETMGEYEKEIFRQHVPIRLIPTGGSEWPIDQVTSDFTKLSAEDDIMQASMLEDRRLLSTFWALCSQRITIESRWEPDRATRRQAARKGHKIPSVRVITLREPTTRTGVPTGKDVEWSHRWIVGAHWRNQFYPSDGSHRPKLIEAYQKGPEDKPLVVRETVRALVR